MAEVIEVEIEQASEQEQRGREDEVVSVLSRLRPPVASDLSRKTKLFWQSTYGKLQYLINKQKLMKSSCLRCFYLLYLLNQPCNIHLLLFK